MLALLALSGLCVGAFASMLEECDGVQQPFFGQSACPGNSSHYCSFLSKSMSRLGNPYLQRIIKSPNCCCDSGFYVQETTVIRSINIECVQCPKGHWLGPVGVQWLDDVSDWIRVNLSWLESWLCVGLLIPYFLRWGGQQVFSKILKRKCGFDMDTLWKALKGERLPRPQQDSEVALLENQLNDDSALYDVYDARNRKWHERSIKLDNSSTLKSWPAVRVVWLKRVGAYKRDYCHWKYLRPSIPDPAHMTFEEMRTSLRIQPYSLAVTVACARLLGWHWLQWLLYNMTYIAYFHQIKKGTLQKILGSIVIFRENMYFLFTWIGMLMKPAYLLYSISVSANNPSMDADAAIYIFGPEKWLLRVIFSKSFRWSIVSLSVSCVAFISDLCSMAALVNGIILQEVWFPTFLCYFLDTLGALVFLYYGMRSQEGLIETPLQEWEPMVKELLGALTRAGLDVSDLKAADFTDADLKAAGFTASDLKPLPIDRSGESSDSD
mmetsp:Transcript_55749/g.100030  ORF Transcript_55749/g.100030 Transcript_55749/m.100030 type:complete len:494 (-) Transcript_55749:172-1653(-)